MSKKEFTKKQLKKQLIKLTEATKAPNKRIKSELKKAYMALKHLKSLLIGHKAGDQTLSFSDIKTIKTAARKIEDIYEDMVDTEIDEKESEEAEKIEKKNEQSEGHGKMYNALSNIKEGKVIKMNEGTLKRIVERVIKEQKMLVLMICLVTFRKLLPELKRFLPLRGKSPNLHLPIKNLQTVKRKPLQN